jgi:hypothetical protein
VIAHGRDAHGIDSTRAEVLALAVDVSGPPTDTQPSP